MLQTIYSLDQSDLLLDLTSFYDENSICKRIYYRAARK